MIASEMSVWQTVKAQRAYYKLAKTDRLSIREVSLLTCPRDASAMSEPDKDEVVFDTARRLD